MHLTPKKNWGDIFEKCVLGGASGESFPCWSRREQNLLSPGCGCIWKMDELLYHLASRSRGDADKPEAQRMRRHSKRIARGSPDSTPWTASSASILPTSQMINPLHREVGWDWVFCYLEPRNIITIHLLIEDMSPPNRVQKELNKITEKESRVPHICFLTYIMNL